MRHQSPAFWILDVVFVARTKAEKYLLLVAMAKSPSILL
jgi:hypothetical protein